MSSEIYTSPTRKYKGRKAQRQGTLDSFPIRQALLAHSSSGYLPLARSGGSHEYICK